MEAIQTKPFDVMASGLGGSKSNDAIKPSQAHNIVENSAEGENEVQNSPQGVAKKSGNQKKFSISDIHSYIKEKYCTEHQVVGVEIQPDNIRIAEAVEVDGKWALTKLASKNILNAHSFESLKKNKRVYVETLKQIFSENKITNKNIAFAVPASLAITKTVSLPLMSAESLAKATKIPSFWQNLVQISENLAEYSIYYKIVKEVPDKKEMDILFVAVKQSDLNVYTQIINEAGLNLVVVDVGCFPIINLAKLASSEAEAKKQVYLKVGKDENYLEVLEDGKPSIYDIFVPENEKAYLNEYLEHQTFQQRFSSQLKHIISKHEEKFVDKIENIDVISSEGEIIKLIDNLNVKIPDINFEQTNLFENIAVNEKIFGGNIENKSAFAIVTGLATRKIEIFADDDKKSISDSINLLPDAKKITKDLRTAFYSKIALGSIVAICCLAITFYSIISASKYQANYNEISKFNNLQRVYQEKTKNLDGLNTKSGTLNKFIKFSDEIPANQKIIIDAYSQISLKIPEGLWLERIEFDDNNLLIIGRAFEEGNIINFTKAFEENHIVGQMSIKTMKSLVLNNGSFIKEFVMTGKLKIENKTKQGVK